MYQNDYGAVAERWKVTLVTRRAKRMGFRPDELADLQQTIVPEISAFKFDPAKANGASELTALTAMVDRQLRTARRAKTRYRKRLKQMQVDCGLDESTPEDRRPQPSYENRAPMVLDVREAVARLQWQDRHICLALAAGQSIDEIAKGLGCGWHTIQRRICRIREHFERIGLDGWVRG